MLYHIEGTVAELEPGMAVIDCGGVGFALCCTPNTVAALKLGAKGKLYVSEAIGENNYDLYGFAKKSEKRSFEMLQSVSGIGPKAALSILSCATPEALALAIINGDEKTLTSAPGIGKKIAQRVILELKDKVSKELEATEMQFSPAFSAPVGTGVMGDAMAGLAVLGYSSAEINTAIKQIDASDMSAEQIIKAALRCMVK